MFVKQDFGWEITQWILAKKKINACSPPPDFVPSGSCSIPLPHAKAKQNQSTTTDG
jgi:hypothetical protein